MLHDLVELQRQVCLYGAGHVRAALRATHAPDATSDTKRLDWLEAEKAHVGYIHHPQTIPGKREFYVQTLERGLNRTRGGDTLREAIDNAMPTAAPESATQTATRGGTGEVTP